jgi:adenylate cyclase
MQAASFASLFLFSRTRRYELFRVGQLLLSPFLLMLSLGGFAASSAVILWSLTSPLGALVFAGRRPATEWFLAYLGLIVLGAVLSPDDGNELPQALITNVLRPESRRRVTGRVRAPAVLRGRKGPRIHGDRS